MEFNLPDNLRVTTDEYITQFQSDVASVSEGRLYDFSASSFLSVLAESQALFIQRFQQFQQQIIPLIQSDMLSQIGFDRDSGSYAVCTVRFQLDNTFDREFIIQRGTRFLLTVNGNATFSTLYDLIIPAQLDTSNPTNYDRCSVDAVALDIGEIGNQPAQQATILQVILGVNSIWIDQPSKGGVSEESTEIFFNRVSLTISKFLESQFNLIESSEFETATKAVLGSGSSAIAIPDVSSDGTTKQLASMLIYALNGDGSNLTEAQIRALSTNFGTRSPLVGGRLAFRSLPLVLIDINITMRIDSQQETTTVLNQINNALKSRFNFDRTSQESSLEFYELIAIVKNNGGIQPIANWRTGIDAFSARNLPLPKLSPVSNATAPAKVETVTFTIEPTGAQYVYNN